MYSVLCPVSSILVAVFCHLCPVSCVPLSCVYVSCVPVSCVPVSCVPVSCVPISCVPVSCVLSVCMCVNSPELWKPGGLIRGRAVRLYNIPGTTMGPGMPQFPHNRYNIRVNTSAKFTY